MFDSIPLFSSVPVYPTLFTGDNLYNAFFDDSSNYGEQLENEINDNKNRYVPIDLEKSADIVNAFFSLIRATADLVQQTFKNIHISEKAQEYIRATKALNLTFIPRNIIDLKDSIKKCSILETISSVGALADTASNILDVFSNMPKVAAKVSKLAEKLGHIATICGFVDFYLDIKKLRVLNKGITSLSEETDVVARIFADRLKTYRREVCMGIVKNTAYYGATGLLLLGSTPVLLTGAAALSFVGATLSLAKYRVEYKANERFKQSFAAAGAA